MSFQIHPTASEIWNALCYRSGKVRFVLAWGIMLSWGTAGACLVMMFVYGRILT